MEKVVTLLIPALFAAALLRLLPKAKKKKLHR